MKKRKIYGKEKFMEKNMKNKNLRKRKYEKNKIFRKEIRKL